MATSTAARPATSIVATIQHIATSLGVDPDLALAIAYHESSLNPQAVGDGGTSFGLYQLHQGGELGNLTKQQAFDPATNATVALTQVAAVQKQEPGASPGQIAADAQRPADKAGYANSVNATYNALKSGSITPNQLATTSYAIGPAGAVGPNAATGNTTPAGAGFTLRGQCRSDIYLINASPIHFLNECQAKAVKGAALAFVGGAVMIIGVALIITGRAKIPAPVAAGIGYFGGEERARREIRNNRVATSSANRDSAEARSFKAAQRPDGARKAADQAGF